MAMPDLFGDAIDSEVSAHGEEKSICICPPSG